MSGKTWSTWKVPSGLATSTWNSMSPMSGLTIFHQVHGAGVVVGSVTLNQLHCMIVSVFFTTVIVTVAGYQCKMAGSSGITWSTWKKPCPTSSMWNSMPVASPDGSRTSHHVHGAGSLPVRSSMMNQSQLEIVVTFSSASKNGTPGHGKSNGSGQTSSMWNSQLSLVQSTWNSRPVRSPL